jgi:hypothetical protein
MSLATDTSYNTYPAGSGNPFVIPFKFNQNADIVVSVTDSTNNVTKLTLDTGSGGDYTLTGAGNVSGGSANITAPISTTSKVTIARVVTATQLSSFTTGDRLPASTLEAALDKITMLYQQAYRMLNKTVRGADTASDLTPLATFPTDGLYNLSNDHGALKWLTPATTSIGNGSIIPANISTQTQTGWSFSAAVSGLAGFLGNLTGNLTGNLLSSTGSVIVDNTASTFTGNVTGNITGNVTGNILSPSGSVVLLDTTGALAGNASSASAPQSGSVLAAGTAKAWVTINPNPWTYSAASLFTTAYTTNNTTTTSTVTMTKTAVWTAATATAPAMIPAVGDWVTVSGVTGITSTASINGTWQVTAVTTISPYTFSFVVPGILTGSPISTAAVLKGVSIIGTPFNVSSISRTGDKTVLGTLLVKFTGTPFADTNYMMLANTNDFTGSTASFSTNLLVSLVSGIPTYTNKTTSSCTFSICTAGALIDTPGYSQLVFFGN